MCLKAPHYLEKKTVKAEQQHNANTKRSKEKTVVIWK